MNLATATIADLINAGISVTLNPVALTLSASEAPVVAPVTSTVESESRKADSTIQAKYKNGNLYREWNLSNFDKETQKSLKLFTVLFNDGYHAYQIMRMTRFSGNLESIALRFKFTAIRRNILEEIRVDTFGIIARIKAI